ncbi:MAG: type II secretion system F family protein [Pirellulaceae bacterium]|nr:type II secretion system F family protein [Pirellulaceae bacterium]
MAKMGMKRLAQCCRRMGTSLRAGVDIRTVWKSESQRGPMPQREAMGQVLRQISTGYSVADALKNSGDLFPPLALEMVDVGERTGRLEAVLLRLAEHYDHLLRLRRDFLSGITWPLIELGAAIGIVGFMILIFGILGQSLERPLAVFGLSGFKGLAIYLAVVLAAGGVIGGLIMGLIRGWFGELPMAVLLRTPVVGECLRTMALSRFAWCLSMALDSGVDARRAMGMALGSTQNVYFTAHAAAIDDVLARGGQFHESLRAPGTFPDEFCDQIETAELSGTHTESLDRLAVEYRERAEQSMRNLTVVASTLFGAFVMLGLGGLVIYLFKTIYIDTINEYLP